MFLCLFDFYPSLNMSLAKHLHTKKLKLKSARPLALDILRKIYIVSSAILLDWTAQSTKYVIDAAKVVSDFVIFISYNVQNFATLLSGFQFSLVERVRNQKLILKYLHLIKAWYFHSSFKYFIECYYGFFFNQLFSFLYLYFGSYNLYNY